jgi:anti-sigma regulatory factor (Ser/Thr protein kinase)
MSRHVRERDVPRALPLDEAAAPIETLGSGTGSAPAPVPPTELKEDRLMTAPWPLRDTLELGAQPGAVPSARLHARAIVYEWRLAELVDTVELLVAELVSNAVQASASMTGPAYPPVFLRLSSDGLCILIEVWDASSDPPVMADVDPMAESGRGLQLVDAISAKWSWSFPEAGGKIVWSEVRRD